MFPTATQVLQEVAQELVHLQVEVGAAYVSAATSNKSSAELMEEIVQKFQPNARKMDTTPDVDAALSGTAPAAAEPEAASAQRRRGNLRSQLLAVSTCEGAGGVRGMDL